MENEKSRVLWIQVQKDSDTVCRIRKHLILENQKAFCLRLGLTIYKEENTLKLQVQIRQEQFKFNTVLLQSWASTILG